MKQWGCSDLFPSALTGAVFATLYPAAPSTCLSSSGEGGEQKRLDADRDNYRGENGGWRQHT